jgi:hypothetical protein
VDGTVYERHAGAVDLERGVLSITRALNGRTGEAETTKSGETRRCHEVNLLPRLRVMHDEVKGRGHVVGWHEPHMSRGLRRWLKRAGVDRDELHNGTPTRKPLTWHDLRATGLTWMAVRGDDPLKVKQRAGHATSAQPRSTSGRPRPRPSETPLATSSRCSRPACFESSRIVPGRFPALKPAKNKAFLERDASLELVPKRRARAGKTS